MKKILVILGPTATGKTDLALELAKKFNGELLACDSRQVYKKLDIGTGKFPGYKTEVIKGEGFWEIEGVKIWGYDLISLDEQFTVYDYCKFAKEKIEELSGNGKLPIIVGGTGLYLKSLLEGIPNLGIPVDEDLRGELEQLSVVDLQKKLEELSPTKWESLNNSDRNNPRRLLRSIEIIMNPYIGTAEGSSGIAEMFEVLKIGLSSTRDDLYKKVDSRVVDWISDGIIEEVRELNKDGVVMERFRKLGLEYQLIADYLEGEIGDEQELIKRIQFKIHGYVRRQLTWYKKEVGVEWFESGRENFEKIEKRVGQWYDI